MEEKKVNIVTINLNNVNGLKRTVESVFYQTFFDKVNYIVIDGGSTDGSVDFLEKNSSKFSYWCSEKDGGLYNAMNKGISHCKGEYVLFLNSGDNFFSNKSIECMYDELDADIVYGKLHVCGNGINMIKSYPKHITRRYMQHDTIPHPSSFIRLKLFDEEKYDETFKIISDWVFFYNRILRFGASYKYVDKIISTFYLGGVSSDSKLIKREQLSFFRELDKKPRITIIMTCYNYSNYITEAIDSVIKSTYKNWRCIIVNDGSIDDSEKVILDKIGKDDRFTYIRQTNKGLAYSRNQGIRASESEYILNLDADDKISDTYLENGIKYLDRNRDCSIYYGKAKLFYDDGYEEEWKLPKFDYKLLLVSNHVYSSFIFRKEEFEEVGGYDETMDAYEDWEFLVRFMRGKKAYMTDDVVFYYRRHRGSMDSSFKKNVNLYRQYILYKNFKTVKEDLEKWKLEVEKSTN